MISMTGYGKAAKKTQNYEIEMEIKSVNAKFFDLKCYLPKDVNYLEIPLRNVINQSFNRGSIEVRLKYIDFTKPTITINQDRLKLVSESIRKIMKACKTETMPLEFILKEFDLINFQSHLFELAEFNTDVIEVLRKAIANQQKTARKEGNSIKMHILKSTDLILKALSKIEKTIPSFRKELFEKMKVRVESVLTQSFKIGIEQRLMQELALYLDKYDIQEELNRLKEHIDTLRKHIVEKEENDVGKTLNFIFQEMHREANTLGSKYSNQHSFGYILSIKEEIEKCREIIQNVM